jgi:hypothetical protein
MGRERKGRGKGKGEGRGRKREGKETGRVKGREGKGGGRGVPVLGTSAPLPLIFWLRPCRKREGKQKNIKKASIRENIREDR